VFDFNLGNPYGDPPPPFPARLARLCADPPPGLHRYMPMRGFRRPAGQLRGPSPFHGTAFTEDLLVMTVGARAR